jgi:peptide/nickel transport system permease protein
VATDSPTLKPQPQSRQALPPSRQRQERKVKSRSQTALIWLRFKQHRVAVISLMVFVIFSLMALFAEFIAPNDPVKQFVGYNFAPPRPLHFVDSEGDIHLVPFIYDYSQEVNMDTFERVWTEDTERRYSLKFLVKGYDYRLLGLFKTDRHLFGLEEGAPPLLLFGSDASSRDLFSRTIYASRISLSIAVFGVIISIVVGVTLGGLSGYLGGMVDEVVQRISELLLAIPKIPLWMAFAVAIPYDTPPIESYLYIVIIASLTNWPGVARGVRSKLISLRNEDYVLAATSYGAGNLRIIFRYLLPNFVSYIIVAISLGIPGMILMETALSFLGIGIRSPAVSWGVLLYDAQNFTNVITHTWLLIPGIFVIVAILSINFIGDGLRDAADPYEKLT